MNRATRDRLKRQAQEGHASTSTATIPPPLSPLKGMPPGPEKTAAREAIKAAEPQVKHSCGHSSPVSKFAGKKCGKCQNDANHERAEKEKAARQAKTAGKDDRGVPLGFRWPAGTRIEKTWDGEQWLCSVFLLDGPSFAERGSSSFRTEGKLAQHYLEWQREQHDPA